MFSIKRLLPSVALAVGLAVTLPAQDTLPFSATEITPDGADPNVEDKAVAAASTDSGGVFSSTVDSSSNERTCFNPRNSSCKCLGDGKIMSSIVCPLPSDTKSSLIDNQSYNLIHTAYDYHPASAALGGVGCAPCGDSSASNPEKVLFEVQIERIHRFREQAFMGSLGPGVFLSYDKKIALTQVNDDTGAIKAVEYFDPTSRVHYRFEEDATTPGHFTDDVYLDIAGIQLYQSYDTTTGTGIPVAAGYTNADVSHAVLTHHFGYTEVYEIIDNESRTMPLAERRQVHSPSGPAGALPAGQVTAFGFYLENTNGSIRLDNLTFSDTSSNVLYRETFPRDNSSGEDGGEQADREGWKGIRHSRTYPQLVSIYQSGSTTGDIPVNSNPVGPDDDGQLYWSPKGVSGILMYTDEYAGMTVSDIDSVSFETRHNTTSKETNLAICVDGVWYVSTAGWLHNGDNSTWETKSIDFSTLTWQVAEIDTVEDNVDRGGRLVQEKDRNGYALNLTYHHPATAGSDLPWQIATITDPYSNSLQITYETNQVSGRWAIDTITAPNGGVTDYDYANGLLETITHPNGDVSTFGVTADTARNLISMTYDDAAADPTSRKKTVWLTNQYSSIPDENDTTIGHAIDVVPAAAQLVRLVQNGAGEVTYANLSSGYWRFIFEGGILKAYQPSAALVFAKDWSIDNPNGDPLSISMLNATWETNYQSQVRDETYTKAGIPSERTNARGLTRQYTYAANKMPTTVTYPDGSVETTTYNNFRQMTSRIDRIGRETRKTYDAFGNCLSVTRAFGTPDAVTTTMTYFPVGHPNAGRLASVTDATGDTTDYSYYPNGRLHQVIEPADVAGGPRAMTSYAYDSSGRMTSASDAENRTVNFFYDTRGRLTTRQYADTSTETLTYGNSANGTANLVVVKKDRNDFEEHCRFDSAGRETLCTTGVDNTPGASNVSLLRSNTYLPGTNRVLTRTTGDVLDLNGAPMGQGNTTAVTYDFRHRRTSSVTQANASRQLVTRTVFGADNRVNYRLDPYGRKSYTRYDINVRPTKQVRELVPDALTESQVATVGSADQTNPSYVVTETTYDSAGQVLSRTNARGYNTTYAYDQRGNTVSVTEAAGTAIAATTTFGYDDDDNRVLVTYPQTFADQTNPALSYQYAVATEYNGRDLPSRIIDAVGSDVEASREITYTLTRKLAAEENFRGFWTNYTYGVCCNRLETVTDPTGAVTTFSYDFYGNRTTVVDPNGNVTSTTFDARHRPVTMTNGAGETQTYAYFDRATDLPAHAIGDLDLLAVGSAGTARQMTNAAGETTTSITDGAGRSVRTIAPLGHNAGTPTIASPLSHATKATYDTLVTFTDVWADNGAGNGSPGVDLTLVRRTQSDALGNTVSSDSDGAGRARRSTDALGFIAFAVYDSNGNVVMRRDANETGLDCVFDARDRMVSCTDTRTLAANGAATGDVTQTVFDSNNNVIQTIDAKGKTVNITYDARQRRVATVDRVSGTTRSRYDDDNNLIQLMDGDAIAAAGGGTPADNATTLYGYDERNLLVDETFPQGTDGRLQRTYGYDPGGRLTSRTVFDADLPTDPDRIEITTYGYDAANRLLNRSYPTELNAPSDSFSYDLASRMLTAHSQRYDVNVSRTYDANSRLIDETMAVSIPNDGIKIFSTGSVYDEANRRTEVAYPSGATVQRGYTPRYQLASVAYQADGTSPVVDLSVRSYDAGGRLTADQLGNGLAITHGYTADNQHAAIQTLGVVELSYAYDINGNKVTTTNALFANRSETFAYDDDDRLIDWQEGAGTAIPRQQLWTLSLVGNWDLYRDELSGGAVVLNDEARTFSTVHEIASITRNGAPVASPTWDFKGNLISNPDKNLSVTTSSNAGSGNPTGWDHENRLREISTPSSGAPVTYRYDALGRRIAKVVDAATTVFVLDGAQVIEERVFAYGQDGSSPSRAYVYGSYVDEPLVVANDQGDLSYYHRDHRYSVVAMTDAAGSVTERYAYTAYGDQTVLDPSGSVATNQTPSQPYGHTGRRHDNETGLQYFRARYFDAELGRFISRDPLRYVDGMSQYRGYFAPGAVDPSGKALHLVFTAGRIIAAGLVGGIQAIDDNPNEEWGQMLGKTDTDIIDAGVSWNGDPSGKCNDDRECPKGSDSFTVYNEIFENRLLWGWGPRWSYRSLKIVASYSWANGKLSGDLKLAGKKKGGGIGKLGTGGTAGGVGFKVTSVVITPYEKDYDCECKSVIPCVRGTVTVRVVADTVGWENEDYRETIEFFTCADGSHGTKEVL